MASRGRALHPIAHYILFAFRCPFVFALLSACSFASRVQSALTGLAHGVFHHKTVGNANASLDHDPLSRTAKLRLTHGFVSLSQPRANYGTIPGVETPRRPAYTQPIEAMPCVSDFAMLSAATKGIQLGQWVSRLPYTVRTHLNSGSH
jgi:hypothetical protein